MASALRSPIAIGACGVPPRDRPLEVFDILDDLPGQRCDRREHEEHDRWTDLPLDRCRAEEERAADEVGDERVAQSRKALEELGVRDQRQEIDDRDTDRQPGQCQREGRPRRRRGRR